MPISIACPNCGKQHQVQDHFAGRTGTCSCGHKMQVPGSPPPSQPPPPQTAPASAAPPAAAQQTIERPGDIKCPNCGMSVKPAPSCEFCGRVLPAQPSVSRAPATRKEVITGPQRLHFHHLDSASYARLMVALTILIYSLVIGMATLLASLFGPSSVLEKVFLLGAANAGLGLVVVIQGGMAALIAVLVSWCFNFASERTEGIVIRIAAPARLKGGSYQVDTISALSCAKVTAIAAVYGTYFILFLSLFFLHYIGHERVGRLGSKIAVLFILSPLVAGALGALGGLIAAGLYNLLPNTTTVFVLRLLSGYN